MKLGSYRCLEGSVHIGVLGEVGLWLKLTKRNDYFLFTYFNRSYLNSRRVGAPDALALCRTQVREPADAKLWLTHSGHTPS